jgi:hypothetical protein
MTRRTTLIAGGLAFVIAAVAALLASQQCAPCLIVPIGLAVGYLAARGQAEALVSANAATQLGARAGVAAGLGALLGHIVGGVFTALRGPQFGSDILAWILGGPGAATPPALSNPTVHFVELLGISVCVGLVEVALVAGAGALGALVRYQQAGGSQRSTALTRR